MAKTTTIPKLQVFIIIWLGQIISLFGSGLTGFALGVWVYQQTASTTLLGLVSLFTALPGILLSPIAGAFVDRAERRWIMILSSCGGGLATFFLALLSLADKLNVWHIYIGMSIISVCSTLQYLAASAAITLLVPKRHLGRASGMVQIGEASARVFAPALAGLLVLTLQIQGVLLIDFASYVLAIVTLLFIQFPEVKNTIEDRAKKASLLEETIYGWTYIFDHPGLLALLLFFALGNFVLGMGTVLVTPMLLAFTSPAILGNVLSTGGSGMFIGSIVMSVWGGPKKRVYGMFCFGLLQGVAIILLGLRPSIPLIAIAAFGVFFSVPIITACSQAIWQSKVAPEIQGRVFAVRRMIAWSSFPLAYLLAGPLADYVFEPLLASDGLLAGSVGKIIGVGNGRGIGLLFIVLGIITVIVTISGYLYKPLRTVEKEMPDLILSK
ncbi:major facilitator superfamily MFS_1 [Nostoc sp. NIES-4103]|nr:major facilitator superfamily MFS_1 [Nostoc sp. NIES-4103]